MRTLVRRVRVATRVIDEPCDETDEEDGEAEDDERKTEEDAEREDGHTEAQERRRDARTWEMDLVLGRRPARCVMAGHSDAVY